MSEIGTHVLEKELKDMNENVTNVRLDIRELTTEIRNIKEMQATVNEHSISISKNADSLVSAHKRLDKVDKLAYFAIGALIVSWIGLIVWIAQTGGV